MGIDRRTVLRGLPLFEHISDAHIELLSSRVTERQIQQREVVFLEGESPRGLLVLARGSVKIFNVGESGREQILEIVPAPASIAELPLLDGLPYPASCAALEESVVLQIPAREFLSLIESHPALARSLIAGLSRRLRSLVNLVEELGSRMCASASAT